MTFFHFHFLLITPLLFYYIFIVIINVIIQFVRLNTLANIIIQISFFSYLYIHMYIVIVSRTIT